MNARRISGFTLAEVLVALAIVSILATIAYTSFGAVREKTRDAQRINDIHQIQLALRLHQERAGVVPDPGVICADAGACNASVNQVVADAFTERAEDPFYGRDDYFYEFDGDLICANQLEGTDVPYCLALRGGVNPVYSWTTSGWGSCSASCGGGTQTRTVTCEYGSCYGNEPARTQVCNTQRCPTSGPWTVGAPYGSCSASCGGGTRTRTVTCGYDSCTGSRPSQIESCNTQSCAPPPDPYERPNCLSGWRNRGSGSREYCYRTDGHTSCYTGSLSDSNGYGQWVFASGPRHWVNGGGNDQTDCQYIWRP